MRENVEQELEVKEASKVHLQQWCGQSAREAQTASRIEAKTGMQGSERVKKWPCSYCQKEFSTRSHRIAHECTSCRNRPTPLSLSINQQAREQAPSVPETTVDNPFVPVSQLASTSDVSAQTPTTSSSSSMPTQRQHQHKQMTLFSQPRKSV